MHRDIKPENILLVFGVVKLADFGCAAFCESERSTFCGTLDYASPEILNSQNYDFQVDIWCIGILTYELLTGKAPFSGKDKK